MIEQIEKISMQFNALRLGEWDALANGKIYIVLAWAPEDSKSSVPNTGYAGEMTGTQYIMIDAPTMSGGKFDLPSCRDVTSFDAYSFCLSDKDVVSIVHWTLVRHYYQQATPTASILQGSAWWDRLFHSFRLRADVHTLRYGLRDFDAEEWQSLRGLMMMPTAEPQHSDHRCCREARAACDEAPT